jgi:hypothetical protein
MRRGVRLESLDEPLIATYLTTLYYREEDGNICYTPLITPKWRADNAIDEFSK